MMVEPKMEDLLKIVDTKYTLCVLSAKRARQINDYFGSLHRPDILRGVPPLVDSESNKPLTVALEEIAAGKLKFNRTRDGIK